MNNTKHLITITTAAIALLGAASSFAQTYGDVEGARQHAQFLNWKSTKSRADVQAELRQAQRDGLIAYGDRVDSFFITAPFKSDLSRAQVRAEAIEARRLGLLDDNGDREPKVATPAQAESIRQAGLRAAGIGTLAVTR